MRQAKQIYCGRTFKFEELYQNPQNHSIFNNFYLVFYCRCFGLLISHGRNVRHSDMNLVEMVRTSWHPTMHQFLPYKDIQDHLLTFNNALVASI